MTEYEYDDNGVPISGTKRYVQDTIWHNGQAYTMNSPEAKLAETDWKSLIGFTIKSGANLNLDEYNNVFFNLGYISKAPRFNNVYTYDNTLFRNIEK